MKPTFNNRLISSFYLWLDHEIISVGGGFYNHSGSLQKTSDPNFGETSSIYASPYRQWVYDSSITNATIPSGVFINNVFTSKLTSGLNIDFNKGRAIFENNIINHSQNITAAYSCKEYNLYYTDEKEETLLFEKAPTITSSIKNSTSALGYLDLPFPCIFIKNTYMENEAFAFGGQKKTNTIIRCIALASNSFSLDALISVLADAVHKNFPVLNDSELPFNYFGDLKSGIFNYEYLCNSAQQNKLAFIENVSISKLHEIENAKLDKKCIAALIDFDIVNIRYIN